MLDNVVFDSKCVCTALCCQGGGESVFGKCNLDGKRGEQLRKYMVWQEEKVTLQMRRASLSVSGVRGGLTMWLIVSTHLLRWGEQGCPWA